MNVAIPIYFATLGYDAVKIGLIFTLASTSSAVFMLAFSYLGDVYGKKKLLILLSLVMAASGLTYYASRDFALVVLAAMMAGVGGGGGGGAGGGPYAPLQNALLADLTDDDSRTYYISFTSTIGSISSAFGTLLAFLPAMFGLQGFRALFLITALMGLIQAALLSSVRERPPSGRKAVNAAIRRNASLITKFSIAGVFSGFGMGLMSSFFPYWFYVRFGVNLDGLTPLFFASSLINAAAYPLAAKMAKSFGSIKVITATRFAGVVALAAIPLCPSFPLAAVAYVLRGVLNGMAVPVRQSYTLGVVDEDARTTTQGISGISRRASTVAAPALTGYLMEYVSESLPLFLSAGFLAANAALYWAFFHGIKPPEEQTEGKARNARRDGAGSSG